MKSSQTISRNLEQSNPFGYASLRREGIALSQDLSGLEWSDYNSHDPGVTILEQLCFALTDLIYRTRFDVADYLCDESGAINTQALGLHAPQDVFFTRPTTAEDYRKALIDQTPGIQDLELFCGEVGVRSGGYGIYKIQLRTSELGGRAEQAIVDLKRNFHSMRNLGEDLDVEVELVGEQGVELVGEVAVRPGYRPATVAARLYHAAMQALSPALNYRGYGEDWRAGIALDESFTGPFTSQGLLEVDSSGLAGESLQVIESRILMAAQSIDGIDYVSALRLVPKSENSETTAAEREAGSETVRYQLLVPQLEVELKGLRLISEGRPGSIAFDEFSAQFDALRFATDSKAYRLEEDPDLSADPEGQFRDLGAYQSVQNQFPSAYGINKFGVPDSYPNERKAQALQLKSYLLLFEQIMSNYLANLGSIRQLFSIRGNDHQSYYGGVLSSEEIGSLERIYPENAESLLGDLLNKVDDFINRKSRLLDYLLAMYGEEFNQERLRGFNYYMSEAELQRSIIFNKIRLLNRIKYASGDRLAAQNIHGAYSGLSDPAEAKESQASRLENVSGLQYRVSILLGFRYLMPRSLVQEVFRHELMLVGTETTVSASAAVFEARDSFVDREEYSEDDRRYYAVVKENLQGFEPLQQGRLDIALLRAGVRDSAYHYDPESDELSIDSGSDAGAPSRLLRSGGQKEADKQKGFLRRLLVHLNAEAEGMHVVEHILLRPSDFDRLAHDHRLHYSNRISVLFAGWTARCSDPEFRMMAEELVRKNCPAHIHADIFWLDFPSMCQFELLQRRWRDCVSGQSVGGGLGKAEGNEAGRQACDRESRKMMAFLELQKDRVGGLATRSGFQTAPESLNEELKHFVDSLMKRRRELELSPRRVLDEEQRYLQGIELLQSELAKLKFCVVHHMELFHAEAESGQNWEFYVGQISVVLPKLFSFRISNAQNAHFHQIKSILEQHLRQLFDSTLQVHFHWLLPSDLRRFEQLHGDWRESPASPQLAKMLGSSIKSLMAAEHSGDLRQWRSILDSPPEQEGLGS